MPTRQTSEVRNPIPRRRAERQAKTPRGQHVVDKVAEVARTLLCSQPSRTVTVVAIAAAAGLPRASVLLQFPGGIPEIIQMLMKQEDMSIGIDIDRIEKDRRTRSGVDQAMLMVELVLGRAEAFGALYANLLSEALQFTGPRLDEFRASVSFLGLGLLSRAREFTAETNITLRDMALGETLGRTLYQLAAMPLANTGLPPSQWPSRVEIMRTILQAIAQRSRPESPRKTHRAKKG